MATAAMLRSRRSAPRIAASLPAVQCVDGGAAGPGKEARRAGRRTQVGTVSGPLSEFTRN